MGLGLQPYPKSHICTNPCHCVPISLQAVSQSRRMSWTTTFLCFIVVHTAGSSITPTISGVFLAQETLLNYTEAESICTKKYLSSLATLAQVTNAFNHGYESCRWGWVKEHIVIMLRQTPDEDCGRYSLGVLTSECPGLRADSVFCFWSNSTHRGIYTNKSMTSYENATNICTTNGDIIATQMQIEQTTNRSVTFNSTGWYNWGNGFFDINGTFVASRCEAVGNSSSAYCFNSQLPDVLPQTNNTGWKRILIICLLGSIFVVLLLAAIFMKGKRQRFPNPKNSIKPLPLHTYLSLYVASAGGG
ncbi:uncharacterized protein LOC128643331 [Bombina bombina]|uniref:uncharacterized protein LOC128643331 n=1 Tax=Bombina bombina TaxID=8345 RepID=UPI00235A8B47|nr:uncharacterized protein LOC128643331 [Bombina bombina]